MASLGPGIYRDVNACHKHLRPQLYMVAASSERQIEISGKTQHAFDKAPQPTKHQKALTFAAELPNV